MQIVLDTYGLSLSIRNGCFLIASGKEKRMVHPDRITSILVTMPCRISSPAILLAATSEIALVICTRTGKPEARLWSPRFLNTSVLRRKQYGFTRSSQGVNWMKETIVLKLEYQLANVRFLNECKSETDAIIGDIERSIASLRLVEPSDVDGIKKIRYFEAVVAKQYWQVVGGKMPAPFGFSSRTKQHATDAFNSCINYLYGMLRNQVETSILSLGLDPALGCMHRDGYKLPSLVFDLMEPFRPMTDRLLIDAVMSGRLNNPVETDEMGICRINQTSRKKLIGLFNEKLQKTCLYKRTKTSFLNHILLETRQLADQIKRYDN